jgi:cytochrome oxidase Cu insertion factor (SCO1/SenC/PrrC family)
MNPEEHPHEATPTKDFESKVPFILAFFVLLAAVYGGYKWWQVERDRAAQGLVRYEKDEAPPLTEFELTERSGEPFRSKDMLGRVWVASYFFTTCPGNCIRLNENIKLLHDMEELKDVTWVSISCDPDTDTVEELRGYADRRGADPNRWLFCRADLDYIKRVGLGMKLDVFLKGHRDDAVVIDKQGKIRGYFNATSTRECTAMRDMLVELLAEPYESEAKVAASENLIPRPRGSG